MLGNIKSCWKYMSELCGDTIALSYGCDKISCGAVSPVVVALRYGSVLGLVEIC